MQERTALEDQLTAIGRIEQDLDDQLTMIELGEAENDQKVVAEAEAALRTLKAEVARRELEALLSGEADANNSYLEVHAGAGGTESQDWANMLLRMYVRWAEQHGFKVDYIEETDGEEAGIKSATIEVKGRNAYGWLKTERRRASAGAHFAVRFQCAPAHLVRERRPSIRWSTTASISTSRKRTCASTPCAPAAPAASTSTRRNPRSASRIFRPTSWSCARTTARSTATARRPGRCCAPSSTKLELKKREEKAAAEQAAKTDIGWGHQIRSYVLQPYQMVKDLRTGVSTSNTGGVLDGDIDRFMEAALAQKAFGGEAEAVAGRRVNCRSPFARATAVCGIARRGRCEPAFAARHAAQRLIPRIVGTALSRARVDRPDERGCA